MGPVQDAGSPGAESSAGAADPSAADQAASGDAPTAPRRLYQIRDGAMLSGVCNGIAAYFKADVTVVRIVFVLLALFSGGLWFIAYLVMMFVIPFATTGEEHAAASGAPFNAQEVVDRARKHYEEFKGDKEWRSHWRRQRREWRRRFKDNVYWWSQNLQRSVYQAGTATGYFAQVATGLMIPILAILDVLLFIAFITAVFTLATTGSLFGWTTGGAMPLWAQIVILCVIYALLASPLRLMRQGMFLMRGGHHHPWREAWDRIFSLGATVLVGWLAYRYVPAVHDLLRDFPHKIELLWNNLVHSVEHDAPLRRAIGS